MTDHKPPTPAQKSTSEARWQLALIIGIATLLIVAISSGPGWQRTQPSAHAAPQTHVSQKQAEEIARRFQEGVIMLHAKEYEHALTAFHRVLQLDEKLPEAHANAGFALLGMGNARAAADFFDTATTLRPDLMNAYYGLGEALMTLGDKRGALQAMETYLHRVPADDRFRIKAEAAVWELRSELGRSSPPDATQKK